jgi:hypothetical protein
MADAQTLGSVTPPSGAFTGQCITNVAAGQSFVLAQLTSDSATPFVVPSAGRITEWETNQTGSLAPAGEQLGLVVLRAAASGGYTVVGTDVETLPSTLPAGGIVSFPIASPIKVAAGDLLGLWSPAVGTAPACVFAAPGLTQDSLLALGPLSGTLATGQSLPVLTPPGPISSVVLDLAATLLPPSQDAGVTTAAGPANAASGLPAILSSTVTNNGPDSDPVTFTDTVPAGLTINSAVVGSGSCATVAQTVICTITGLAPGESAPADIVVTPTRAGTYQNAVKVSVPSDTTDPNPANDAASAVLSVAPVPAASATFGTPAPAAPAANCLVPPLTRIPAAFARRVLTLLDCRIGSVRRVHSKRVPKGEVIRSTPRAGTYPAAQVVGLQVSSGPAHKKRSRHS